MRITGAAVFAFGAVLLLAGFIAGFAVGRNQTLNEGVVARRAAGAVARKNEKPPEKADLPAARVDDSPLEKEVRERAAAQELKDLNDGDALQKAYLRKLKRDYNRLDDTGRNGL